MKRFRMKDAFGNVEYLYKDTNGRWQLVSRSLVPLALANITDDAALLRFALEDAVDEAGVIDAVRTHCRKPRAESVEVVG